MYHTGSPVYFPEVETIYIDCWNVVAKLLTCIQYVVKTVMRQDIYIALTCTHMACTTPKHGIRISGSPYPESCKVVPNGLINGYRRVERGLCIIQEWV